MKLKVISQYHPAAALHNPRLWAVLLNDWESLPTVVPSDFRIVDKVEPGLVGFDTETDNAGGIGQWSLAGRGSDGLYVVPRYGSDPKMDWGGLTVVMHNAKYDLRELVANGMKTPKEFHDTMIMAYCLGLGQQDSKASANRESGSNMVGGLGLKYLARRHLGMVMKTWKDMIDHPEWVEEYNANDSIATFLLAEKWLPIIPAHYHTIDKPLLPTLMAMEDRGVKIDVDFLDEYGRGLSSQLQCFDLPVNVNATQQLQSLLFGELELEPTVFTDSGAPCVDADVLEKAYEATLDERLKDIIRYKELFKEHGTYIKNYIEALDVNERIHPEFKQTRTSTGRLSCHNPNLQNVPKENSDMRKLFIAEEGNLLVRVDYNQLEWRCLAAVTQDPVLMKQLATGKKIHQITADEMECSYKDAKSGNFCIQYGGQEWTLAKTLGCTINEARDFMSRYFKKFPGVKKYQDGQREIANAEKKVTNYFGRTRRLDAMYSPIRKVRESGEKEAINTPIQGLGGEICKLAMNDLHHKHNAPMLLQVHDELLFEVPEKEAKDYGKWLEEYIPTIVEVNGMRFPVEVSIGKNWKECTD